MILSNLVICIRKYFYIAREITVKIFNENTSIVFVYNFLFIYFVRYLTVSINFAHLKNTCIYIKKYIHKRKDYKQILYTQGDSQLG